MDPRETAIGLSGLLVGSFFSCLSNESVGAAITGAIAENGAYDAAYQIGAEMADAR